MNQVVSQFFRLLHQWNESDHLESESSMFSNSSSAATEKPKNNFYWNINKNRNNYHISEDICTNNIKVIYCV